MLELKDISLQAGSQVLLKKPLSVREAGTEAIVFFGRNGTGKTTLLRAIAGGNADRTNDIRINGITLAKSGIQEWARLVCYISSHEMPGQQINTFEYLLSARLGFTSGLGLYAEKDYHITEKWINEMKIARLLDKNYAYLSDGEKQLVNIARAFIYETPMILLDEPTSSLDVPNKKMITEMLHHYAVNEKKLIIYTSHDYFIAEKYCQRAWYIDHHQQFLAGDFNSLNKTIREDFGID
jgi:iron complex transport system ATP-binding protein